MRTVLRRLLLHAVIGLVGPGLIGMAAPARAELPAPGTRITKENMEQYKEVLFPAVEYLLRHGMWINVVEHTPYEWSKPYKEATEKFSHQVELLPTGEIENYVAGAPFPSIDHADPKAGMKYAWNFQFGPRFTDNVGVGWNIELKNERGERERFFGSNFWRRMMWKGRVILDPKPNVPHDPELHYSEQWGPLHDPSDLRGAGVLVLRYFKAEVPDDTYMYLPELRKVRRLSLANRSDAFWGTDMDMDGMWSFNAKIPMWEFRILAEKKTLQPMRLGSYGKREGWCAQPDGQSGIKSFAPCGNWELVDTIIIEAIPTGYQQYAYSRRILYMDKESYDSLFLESYDHGGQLWRVWVMAQERGKGPTDPNLVDPPKYEDIQVFPVHGGMIDVQLNHATTWDAPDAYLYPKFGIKQWYFNEAKEWNQPDTFTINYLIKSSGF